MRVYKGLNIHKFTLKLTAFDRNGDGWLSADALKTQRKFSIR